ncbi:hypothetical protein, partial [Yeosuana marina]|uniref:hypothetical protein n=1 Tax=Yeosuana marina TaxID=1565536 RepID=UPI0019D0D995
MPTPCKNNCLVLVYSENPTDFPLVRSIFSKLVACTRNYPYTNTLYLISITFGFSSKKSGFQVFNLAL